MSHKFSSPHSLMIQGTTSDAGKSVMVSAFCRILARNGVKVAPFKPQNMALNSAVTADGGEIGRAQAVQAQAANVEPTVYMNPVLLKPNSDTGAQVIVLGKAVGNMQAWGYHHEKPNLLPKVCEAHEHLTREYEAVMIEGAGSPAEINLREGDIANMGFAEEADCPVVIVADIDRGGVFAHLYGTYALLSDTEKARVVGFLINRFRGDVSLLEPGLDWLEEKTGVPTLGVVPYLHDLHIESEDAIQLDQVKGEHQLVVRVLAYPRMSNHTDFDVLRLHPQIDCEFIRDVDKFDGADVIILPGSKHVRADLAWLKSEGWEFIINKHLRYGGKVLGVCGGYQMLGHFVHDPLAIESDAGSSEGLGLLDMETELTEQKALENVSGKVFAKGFRPLGDDACTVSGYEIHAGRSEGRALASPLFELYSSTSNTSYKDGAVSDDGQVLGTYVHGLFDQESFLQAFLSFCGLVHQQRFDYFALREREINRLADAVEQAVGLDKIKALVNVD